MSLPVNEFTASPRRAARAPRALLAALGAALLLSACEAPSASQIGPGPGIVDGQTAGRLFAQVCMAHLPDFAGSPAALTALPFRQHPATGTYYHDSLNLSFKLLDVGGEPACSLVYGTTESPDAAALSFGTTVNAVAGDRPADVDLNLNRGPDGLNYVHATATAQG